MRLILFLYSILAFFVAGGLFFKKSSKSSLALSLFIFMLGLEVLTFLYGTGQLIFIYPQFAGQYYFQSGFIYGPLLLIHLQFYIKRDFRLKPIHLLHLIPFLLALIYLWDMLMMPGAERFDYIQEHFIEKIMPVNYARAVHLLSYGIAMIIFISKKNSALLPKDKLYTWQITAIYFISCVTISWFTEFAQTWRDFDIYYVVSATLTILIGYLLYSDPDFLRQITQKYLKSNISDKDKKRIEQKIRAALEEDKVFKRNDLNLSLFAELIGEKSHHISQTFSELINEPFHECINKHRVELAKKLLTNEESEKYTIEAIGQLAGFNNKVTFGQSFRKLTGLTPSQYRKANIGN